jgi:large subunit ribosomal protein L32
MRSTRGHTRNIRSHHALKGVHFLKCKKCGEEILPHTLCLNCGTYKDREVIDVLAKLTKKERKKKEKELKEEKKEKKEEKNG